MQFQDVFRLGWSQAAHSAGRIAPWCLLAALVFPVQAAEQQLAGLADLSLEQLSEITVTSVSQRTQPLATAPASIFVITAEDIRRSGATSIPEVLRIAPNLEVARANINQYAITARGFNNTLANKLLVLIDGRTVYTPLFSGVFWDAQDVMLQDVERIEVISGPGATVWGTNAVNGVINVITRSSAHTQGTLVSAGAGNAEHGGAVRHGGELGADGHYRVYGKYFNRNDSERADGVSFNDSSERGQGGFRADWQGDDDTFSVQGDAYRGHLDQLPSARTLSGANLLGRWNRRLSEHSSVSLRGYYDTTQRDHPGTFHEKLDIFDIEIRHDSRPGRSHMLTVGGGYRYARDRVENTPPVAFLPPDKNLEWTNIFAQDEIALRHDLRLTLGLKVEHNSYSGNEYLPDLRLAWDVAPNHMLWSAASRAVRAPSRIDREFFAPANPPFAFAGGPDFDSEIARVYQVGYRAQPLHSLSYSITAFRHDYEKLRSLAPRPGGTRLENNLEGTTTGVETWLSLRINPSWRLSSGGVWMEQDLGTMTGPPDPASVASSGNDPRYWWMLRSMLDITPRHEFDITVRRVGKLSDPLVPAYTAVDARLGWRPRPELEASLNLMNLFDPGHAEWGASANRPEYGRAYFLSVTWQP